MSTKEQVFIRVLIVSVKPELGKYLSELLNKNSHIIVVDIIENPHPLETVDIVKRLKPDIILIDAKTIEISDYEIIKQIMAYEPTPILILGLNESESEHQVIFKSLSFGALEAIEKSKIDKELIKKIIFLKDINVIRHPLAKLEAVETDVMELVDNIITDKIIGIVASTGGPQILAKLLAVFPQNFPCPIVLVQHISSGFIEGFADWLNEKTRIKIKVAEDSEKLNKGVVYVAPSDVQMKILGDKTIQLTDEPKCNGHRPSGDILLMSIAKVYKRNTIGVILTGMGADGVNGLKAIKDSNGKTIAQDKNTSVIFGMPKVAIEKEVVDIVLPIDKIAPEIFQMLGQ
ncbi:chemotaxis protein CheB [Candidatus Margulisiibacteriota bacterium]